MGEKNIASSSGWAISRHIRLLKRRGKLRAKGDELVEERVQKRKMAERVRPHVTSDVVSMVTGFEEIATLQCSVMRENKLTWPAP